VVRKVAGWSAGRPWAAGLAVLGSLTCSGDALGPVPQITSIVLSPALDTLASLGDERAVSVQAFSGTQPYAGGAYTWTLSDTGVAYLAVNGGSVRSALVVARANGTTRIRVREAGGAEDSAVVVVRQRVADMTIYRESAYRACPVGLWVYPVDARGHPVPDAHIVWNSSDTTRATVDSTGWLDPRAVGTVVISASADGFSEQWVFTIAAAPSFGLQVRTYQLQPVATVGVGQWVGGAVIDSVGEVVLPIDLTIATSDTTRLTLGLLGWAPAGPPFILAAAALQGRQLGPVTLTVTACDVTGPPLAMTVTPPRLFVQGNLPAEVRLDDDPWSGFVGIGDTTGALHRALDSVTVFVRSTDSTVLRAEPGRHAVRALSPVSARWIGPGVARLVLEDSAGLYPPDTTAPVRVVLPPLLLFGDTVRVGMRQRYTGSVGLDRVPSARVRLHLASSDTLVARVAPDSVDIPIGSAPPGATAQLTAGDTIGVAVVTATADGRAPAQSVVVVETPRVQPVPSFGFDLPRYAGDPPGQVVLRTGDAAPVEDVTFALTSSDPAVIAVDSGLLTIRAGQTASAPTTLTFLAPGTAVLTVADPRAAFYRYAPDTTPPVTVVERRLQFDETIVTLGSGQQRALGIRVAGVLPTDLVVSMRHTNPGVVVLSDTIAIVASSSGYGAVLATAVGAGIDTVVGSAAGWVPDTLIIVVGTGGVVLVGAGDIADCNTEADEATALLLDSIAGTVFTAGDNVYPNGTASQFATCYDSTWGRHRSRTRPSPGNHDYNTSGAAPYYAYFGDAAGPAGRGYYSYDLGAWHVVSLNSNVAMTVGSAQEQWLRGDLAASTARCTLAYWHHPRFSSGSHGNSTAPAPLWQALEEAGADVVLVGHDHNYQRFAPQTAAGVRDDARGIREFVVGTGGRGLYDFATPIANTEAFSTDTHGVLKLTLYADWYAWEFIPVAGGTFRDSGVGTCH
jgi:hypothetical protein